MKKKDQNRHNVKEHRCNVAVAKLYGTEISLILGQLKYWIYRNAENDRNYRNGAYWTYNSAREWSARMPYISYDAMKRLLRKMVKHGLIRTGNWNRAMADRTRWYTITSKGWRLLGEEPPVSDEDYDDSMEHLDEAETESKDEPEFLCSSNRGKSVPVPERICSSGNTNEKQPEQKCSSNRGKSAPVPEQICSSGNANEKQPEQKCSIARGKNAPVPGQKCSSTGAEMLQTGANLPLHTNKRKEKEQTKEKIKKLPQAEKTKSAKADLRFSAGLEVSCLGGIGKEGECDSNDHAPPHLNCPPPIIGHLTKEEIGFQYENELRRRIFATEPTHGLGRLKGRQPVVQGNTRQDNKLSQTSNRNTSIEDRDNDEDDNNLENSQCATPQAKKQIPVEDWDDDDDEWDDDSEDSQCAPSQDSNPSNDYSQDDERYKVLHWYYHEESNQEFDDAVFACRTFEIYLAWADRKLSDKEYQNHRRLFYKSTGQDVPIANAPAKLDVLPKKPDPMTAVTLQGDPPNSGTIGNGVINRPKPTTEEAFAALEAYEERISREKNQNPKPAQSNSRFSEAEKEELIRWAYANTYADEDNPSFSDAKFAEYRDDFERTDDNFQYYVNMRKEHANTRCISGTDRFDGCVTSERLKQALDEGALDEDWDYDEG